MDFQLLSKPVTVKPSVSNYMKTMEREDKKILERINSMI